LLVLANLRKSSRTFYLWFIY